MNVIMPLPTIVQVFNEKKLCFEISCCDEIAALCMFDLFSVLYSDPFTDTCTYKGYYFGKDPKKIEELLERDT